MAEGVTLQNTANETFGKLLARNASIHGSSIAIREKERGIWKESTWAEYVEEVLACAAGLRKFGVKPGKAVLILGDNRARLYQGMLAVSLLGAYAMPAYPGATPLAISSLNIIVPRLSLSFTPTVSSHF